MDDTEKPDPVLMQVPLIRNPSYLPPKAITLNLNYGKLLPTLTKSVVPPKVNISEGELRKWEKDIEAVKLRFEKADSAEQIRYQEWVKRKQTQIAPGFDSMGGIMMPSRVEKTEEVTKAEEINELDALFGKTSISSKVEPTEHSIHKENQE
ncbi:hypothetical protein CLIB1423_12S04104 [[Candida] railenensis]|uniref:Uncharacterized protein n=1 Tax=[Candida] railenensis TaxID=45579 RepID=A0A9P0QRZ3_9ASCO|nr:hypothetical protein CLIB1423_12S04104 [[Candida] railenensis]